MREKNGRNRTRFSLLVTGVILLLVPSLTLAQTDRSGTTHWAGQEIFREKGCANCHSVYGNGGDEGPDLGERKFYGTYLHLASRMWNHFPKMYKKMQEADVEFHRISAEEMGELITYLSFIRYMGEPGRAYKGTELIEKSCMKCHKFGGRGGDIGPDFVSDNEYMTAMQLVEAMWNHGPDMIDVFEEENIKRPTFKGNDIEHILAAIRSYAPTSRIPPGAYVMGDPAVGERLFTEKGCVRCHSVAGVGGTIGVDFAEVDFDYSATEIAGKMWNHGPKMWEAMQRENITFPSFEEGEMAHILAYLYAIKLEDPPGDPDRGEQILRKKRCLSCHSVHGEGGDVSVDLATLEPLDSPPAMIAAMWNHAPGMREKQLEKKVSWPKLKAEEMADLYAYLNRVTQHGEETP